MKSLISTVIILFAPFAFGQSSYDPTSDLILAFGQRCPMSYGNLNSGALADNQSLQKIIDAIRNDPSCQGVAGALQSVQATLNAGTLIAPQADEIALQERQQTCLSLQAAFNEVSAAANNSSDPNYNYANAVSNQLQNCSTSDLLIRLNGVRFTFS